MARIAFAGTAPFGASILEGLLERRAVSLVISQPDRPAGRGRVMRSPAVVAVARERGLKLLQPEHAHDPEVLVRLGEHGTDTIVVAAFGQMIREPLLSTYTLLNVHGSLLPKWRGAAPIERAIMAGGDGAGVAIMRMDAGLDTGPVAVQEALPLGPEDDAGDLYAHAADVGSRLLHETLDALDAGTATFTPQAEDGATYAHKITAEDRALDARRPVQRVHDHIRALSPHIGTLCVSGGGDRLTLWRSRVPSSPTPNLEPGAVWHDTERLLLGCADGELEILELQPAGKRRMPTGDWLRGLRSTIASLHPPTRVASA